MMKKVLLLLLILLPVSIQAQSSKSVRNNFEECIDSLLSQIDTLLMINYNVLDQIEADLSLKNRYRMYKTENMYNFLRLDTKTGKITQVQWSLDDSKEGTWEINTDDLTYGYGRGSNSFELYPTQSMYQFILIDKTDGRMWHVQWGTSGDKSRWIKRIY